MSLQFERSRGGTLLLLRAALPPLRQQSHHHGDGVAVRVCVCVCVCVCARVHVSTATERKEGNKRRDSGLSTGSKQL